MYIICIMLTGPGRRPQRRQGPARPGRGHGPDRGEETRTYDVYIHTHVCVYVYVYIYIYTCVYIYIYIHKLLFCVINMIIYVDYCYDYYHPPYSRGEEARRRERLPAGRQGERGPLGPELRVPPGIYIYMYVCVYIYIYIYVYVHVCVYL